MEGLVFPLPSVPIPEKFDFEQKWLPLHDTARMKDAQFVDPAAMDVLWQAKARLDTLRAQDKLKKYYEVRDRLYPDMKTGTRSRINRSADKLHELQTLTGVGKLLPSNSTFVDLCGGPGAFSFQLLKQSTFQHGFGYTPATPEWFSGLKADKRFTAMTGDIFDTKTVMRLQLAVQRSGKKFPHFVLADGSHQLPDAQETYQELYLTPLIIAECHVALSLLAPGGHLLVKLFDTCTQLTCTLLALISMLFERIMIVKPTHSRIVNSERYLVAMGFRNLPTVCSKIVTALTSMRKAPKDHSLESFLPLSSLPEEFVTALRNCNTQLATMQATTLNTIIDCVEKETQTLVHDTTLPCAPTE